MHTPAQSPPLPPGWKAVKEGGEMHHTIAFRTTDAGHEQLGKLAKTLDGRMASALRWVLDQPVVQGLIEAQITAHEPTEGE